jgi:hypothetical protein
MGRYEPIRLPLALERQTSSDVMMVEPGWFGFNPETAASNRFQHRPDAPAGEIAEAARREFWTLAERLTMAGVDVHLLPAPSNGGSPDAIFPNNWVTFHAEGTIATYPMAAQSRRAERRLLALERLLVEWGFAWSAHIDLTAHEGRGRYLEGTGSLVLDRPARRAYACVSARTDPAVVADFDAGLGYSTLVFRAADADGAPYYHTNVMMSLGTRFALLCAESVAAEDRKPLCDDIEAGGRVVIEISREQVAAFAGNVLELHTIEGRPVVAMSSGALASLDAGQRRALETLGGEIVASPIPTIERVGGGGVRCMLADLHLPRR